MGRPKLKTPNIEGRTLKNYEKYKDKILKYAKSLEIRVEFKEEEDEGKYIPASRTVRVDEDLEDSTKIATLLHELGHVYDFASLEKDIPKSNKINDAYGVIYGDKFTSKQQAIVVDAEKRAWDAGRAIAYQLRIPLGKWYDLEETSGMHSYKTQHKNK